VDHINYNLFVDGGSAVSAWFDSASFLIGLGVGAVIIALLMTVYRLEALGELAEKVANIEKQVNRLGVYRSDARTQSDPRIQSDKIGELIDERELRALISEIQEEIRKMYRKK
jgi:Na+-transporting methylmalonyl-CoA/oxaloacetate decarboxylase gamma subunit